MEDQKERESKSEEDLIDLSGPDENPNSEIRPGLVNSIKEKLEKSFNSTDNQTSYANTPDIGLKTNGVNEPHTNNTEYRNTPHVQNQQYTNPQQVYNKKPNNHQTTHSWAYPQDFDRGDSFKTVYASSYNTSASSQANPETYQNQKVQPNQHQKSSHHSNQERSPYKAESNNRSQQTHASDLNGSSGLKPNEEKQQQSSVNKSEMRSSGSGKPVTPDYTRISNDLADKVRKSPQNTIVPFYIHKNSGFSGNSHSAGHDHSGNKGNVRLPFSPMNKKHGSQVENWDTIVDELLKLRDACNRKSISVNFGKLMQTIVSKYCTDAHQKSNFGMLNRGELSNTLVNTIPLIVDMALMLPQLVASQIPFLKSGESKTIYLTRKLCCSLLANAFFCTFPESSGNRNSNFPDFNFFRLFNDTNSERCEVKKEKIKCILEYFGQFYRLEEKYKYQIVSYERRSIQQKINWAQSNKDFCKVRVDSQQKIEQADGMLQCDFANKLIGGGVINDGSVMEEIRFSICPELIVSRLFTEVMSDNEVVVITGSIIYSDYTGYSTSFKFTGQFSGRKCFETDSLGRTRTQLVALDALSFKKHDSHKQYQQFNIDRELHKCYVAFIHGKHVTGVATGNWGCGAFNGDQELKFLIQWMAASQQDRGLLQYHISDDPKFVQDIIDFLNFLSPKKIDVGQLYKCVIKYDGHGSIFKHVKDNLKGGNFLTNLISYFVK